MDERVLITGIAGFLGSHIAKRLYGAADLTKQLHGVDTLHPSETWRLDALRFEGLGETLARCGRYWWKDVVDLTRGELSDFTTIIHCAASTDVPHTAISPRRALHQSIEGTLNLLENAPPGCRIILISSYSAYGPRAKWTSPLTEESELSPSTLYGAMKAMQETLAQPYTRTHGLLLTTVRPSTMYGPFSRATLPVALFMRQAMKDLPITITGDGLQQRDQNFVENTVDGICALFKDRSALGAYNIGSGETITIKDLAQRCIAAVEEAQKYKSKTELRFVPARSGEEGIMSMDITKMKTTMKYNPKVNLAEGLERTARWFCDKTWG